MKKTLNTIQFLLISIVIAGCSGKSGIPNYMNMAKSEVNFSSSYSYVIIGAKLNPSSVGTSYLYNMLYNGYPVGMQGIVKSKKSRKLWTIHHHIKYNQHKNDTTYLTWRIPGNDIDKDNNESLLYLAVVGTDDNFIGFYYDCWLDISMFSRPLATGLYPYKGEKNPVSNIAVAKNCSILWSKQHPLLNFEGIEIKLSKNTIYYLGDIELFCDLVSEERSFIAGTRTKTIKNRTTISANMTNLKKYLDQNNIKQQVVNLSGNWQKTMPIEKYIHHSRKQVSQ